MISFKFPYNFTKINSYICSIKFKIYVILSLIAMHIFNLPLYFQHLHNYTQINSTWPPYKISTILIIYTHNYLPNPKFFYCSSISDVRLNNSLQVSIYINGEKI